MALQIIKQGIMDSLQDEGRYGYADAGINPGGVMDPYAARIANALVGNTNNEAVLELHFPAAQVLFSQPALIAVCGADFSPAIHDEPIPNCQPVMVKHNSLLHFQKWKWGARIYLAIESGFQADKWLNSYSTHLKAAAGGYHGRLLRKEDVLHPLNDSRISPEAKEEFIGAGRYSRALNWGIKEHDVYAGASQLIVMPGPEWELLDEASKEKFKRNAFTISKKSDRMGCLLNGDALRLHTQTEMVSTGVNYGTIQLLPNGQLMILAADHQTTGGYPRIANVIGAHLPKLAQASLESEVRFTLTDLHTAEQLLFSQMHDLRIIERSCRDRINQFYAR